jgi:hypothetical protein
MSQYDFGVIDPYVTVGVELADMLNQWRDAVYSLHRGGVRPTYIVPGMLWVNDSGGANAWVVSQYISPTVGDLVWFTLNTTTGTITLGPLMQAITPPTNDNSQAVATTAMVQAAVAAGAAATQVPGLINGLTIANDATTPATVLDFNPGKCSDAAHSTMLTLPGLLRKSISGAWASGSGSNGMGQGLAVAPNTWYHAMAIGVGSSVDAYFDTSLTAANKPAGATTYRRLGSVKTNASSQLLPFLQVNDMFLWLTAIRDISNMNLSATSPINVRMSIPPLPVMVQGRMNASNASGPFFIDVLTPGTTGQNNGVIGVPSGQQGSAFYSVMSDALGQLRYVTGGGTTNTIYADTYGWIDTRGRFD